MLIPLREKPGINLNPSKISVFIAREKKKYRKYFNNTGHETIQTATETTGI